MKRVLIISPYFPPSNAADMQRVRMSLPYFKEFGWDAEVVTVAALYSEMVKDDLLEQSVPSDIKTYQVDALNKSVTSKLGIGSLGLRSLWYYRQKVNAILAIQKFDLIYFSTTQFPVCILGSYWKKKFGVPYVIDMQDPWHSDYYQDKPRHERPPKHWFSYRLHKYLEPIAMKQVDGLISVSEYYIDDLKARYIELKNIPSATVTFGAFEPDLEIAARNQHRFVSLLNKDYTNIVYIGRGGADMHKAITPVFEALKIGMADQYKSFSKLKFYFIGTSYAPPDKSKFSILPLAKQFGVERNIVELTDRISYFHTLLTLQQADALFIPGSDSPQYTASKIYPYLLTQKPLLAIFNKHSNAVTAINKCTNSAVLLTFPDNKASFADILGSLLKNWADGHFKPVRLLKSFDEFSAKNLTAKQVELFERVLENCPHRKGRSVK